MGFLTHFFSTMVALSLIASPAGVLLGASTSTNPLPSSANMNASGNTGAIIAAGVIGGAALLAGSQFLLAFTPRLTSFGGRVVTILPCSGGMLHITIIPAGLFPISYIWTPFTITKLYGPPLHPGQQVLGLADIPLVCFVGVGPLTSPVPLYGQRMTTVGTSL